MKNIMESEKVPEEGNVTRESSEGHGPPHCDDEHGFTADEKALLAAWDKTNAPPRSADARFEARVLATLMSDPPVPAPGTIARRYTLALDHRDELTCAEMTADADAEAATELAPRRAPIVVDLVGEESAGGGDTPVRRDWHRWPSEVRDRRSDERDELPFMVRPSDAGPAARGVGVAASWDALGHDDPDDPSMLRQKVSTRLEDDRWQIASEHASGERTVPGLGVAVDLAGELEPQHPRTAVVLFIAASPRNSTQDWLTRRCTTIAQGLKTAPLRDSFRFESRWATTIPAVTGHLAELDPMILHFVGHGGVGPERASDALVFPDAQGNARPVPAHVLTRMIETAGRRVRLVVLDGCFWGEQAEALRRRVDCVLGTHGAIDGDGDGASPFSAELYAGLGNRRSIGAAFECGAVALAAAGRTKGIQTSCLAREGVDLRQLQLWDAPRALPLG